MVTVQRRAYHNFVRRKIAVKKSQGRPDAFSGSAKPNVQLSTNQTSIPVIMPSAPYVWNKARGQKIGTLHLGGEDVRWSRGKEDISRKRKRAQQLKPMFHAPSRTRMQSAGQKHFTSSADATPPPQFGEPTRAIRR